MKSKAFRPRVLVKRLLTGYFKDNLGKKLYEVGIEDLREFFRDFAWHFSDEDIEEFVAEAQEVGIENVPVMMQDNMECSYK